MIEMMPPANDNANEKRQLIDRISTQAFFLGVALLLIVVTCCALVAFMLWVG